MPTQILWKLRKASKLALLSFHETRFLSTYRPIPTRIPFVARIADRTGCQHDLPFPFLVTSPFPFPFPSHSVPLSLALLITFLFRFLFPLPSLPPYLLLSLSFPLSFFLPLYFPIFLPFPLSFSLPLHLSLFLPFHFLFPFFHLSFRVHVCGYNI